jgi:hypothetical protein
MAVNRWRGDAQARRQVDRVVITLPEVGDTFTITCNRKDIVATAEAIADSGYASIELQLYTDLARQIGSSALDPEFKELTAAIEYPDGDATQPPIGLLITGPSTGKPFTITATSADVGDLGVDVVETIKGVAGVNEQQTVTLESTVNGGTFTLTYAGQVTAAIAWNASAATMVTRLEALSNIGVGDVAVTGGSGTAPWVITFQGAFANTDVALMTADGALLTRGAYNIDVSTLVQGNAGLNEIQVINIGNPTSGTFTLTFSGVTSGAIAYNASAATIQTALEAMSNIAPGDVIVTDMPNVSGRTFKVEFAAVYRNTNVPALVGSGASLDGWQLVQVTTPTQGVPAHNAQLDIVIPGSQASHDFAIRVYDYRGGDAEDFEVAVFGPIAGVTSGFDTAVGLVYDENFAIQRNIGNGHLHFVSLSGQTYRFEVKGDYALLKVYTSVDEAVANLGLYVDVVDYNEAPDGDPWSGSSAPTVAVQASATGTNEVQKVELLYGPTGGTFTLTFQGLTTGGIAYNASAATVQTALEALANIAVGDVTVTGAAGGPWTCTFQLAWAATDLEQMTGAHAGLTGNAIGTTVLQEATAYTNEKQKVQILGGPAGGTFTLTWNGVTSAAIAYNASALVVETAIELAFGSGFAVTGAAGGPWTLEFTDGFKGANQTQMTGSGASLTGSAPDVAQTRAAVQPVNEQQTVTLDGGPASGTFTLTYSGQVSAAIPYDASPAVVRNALIALSNIGPSDVAVSGASGGPWVVTFLTTLAATDVVLMTGDGTGLSPGLGTQTCTRSAYIVPTGPNWVNEAENWSLGHVLADTEIGVAEDNAVDMLYGLDQMSGVTPSKLIFKGSYTGKVGLPDWTGTYVEYLPTKLRIGTVADAATMTIEIGEGPGEGPSRLRLDTGDCQVVIECKSTASPANGEQAAFDWVGTHAANIVRCYHTTGRIAGLEGELATIATLVIAYVDNVESDVVLLLGDGVTIGAVTKTGGVLTTHSSLAGAFEQRGGTTYIEEAAGASALSVRGGTVYYSGTGVLGGNTVLSGTGKLDFSRDMRAKTITNPIDVYGDVADVNDPYKVATPMIIDYNETTRSPQLGFNFRITRAATA